MSGLSGNTLFSTLLIGDSEFASIHWQDWVSSLLFDSLRPYLELHLEDDYKGDL